MKIVFFCSYYDHYLEDFYKKNNGLNVQSYEEQLKALEEDYFGVFASYVKYINKQGIQAHLIIPNCKPLQKMWAKEHGVKYTERTWRFDIPIAQVKKIKPDVFFMSSMFEYYGSFLDEVKKLVPKVFGWIACPIPKGVNLKQMGLILTSVPQFVVDFRKQGVNSEVLSAAFDPDILKLFPKSLERDIDFSFIGSFSRSHLNRIEMTEYLLERTPIKIFGTGINLIPDKRNFIQKIFSQSLAEQRYQGEAWGINMYKALRRSKITFNVHIDVSGSFAGNMRMYEATGMGTLLLTDGKKDEVKVFDESEVVYFDSIQDAVEKMEYLLSHPTEMETIALKGQQATLSRYNFTINTGKMLDYFRKYS